MDTEEKFRLITRRLQEVVGEDELRRVLSERDLKVYWGTAPTGAPHFGYFVPMLKIADLLEAGCEVTILFADIHAVLDNLKSTFELVGKRTEYYELVIKSMLSQVGVPLDKLKFVRGSSFQFTRDYTFRMYQLASLTTFKKAQHAGAGVVKQTDDPLLSGCLYPILQSLDEEFLQVDAQFGGVDQRKIFMFAREMLPRVSFQKRIHLMNPLVPGLGKTGKMSSSIPSSKIDFFDTDDVIRTKILRAYSIDGVIEGNCLLAYLRNIIFPMKRGGGNFVVHRDPKFGGDLEFGSSEEVVESFGSGVLVSADLKPAVAEEMVRIITPLREILSSRMDLFTAAYPVAEDVEEVPETATDPSAAVDAPAQQKKPRPGKKSNRGKKKKPPDYGFQQFFQDVIEEHQEEYPDLRGRKLESRIRRDFAVHRTYHLMPDGEKLVLREKWFSAHPEDRPEPEQPEEQGEQGD